MRRAAGNSDATNGKVSEPKKGRKGSRRPLCCFRLRIRPGRLKPKPRLFLLTSSSPPPPRSVRIHDPLPNDPKLTDISTFPQASHAAAQPCFLSRPVLPPPVSPFSHSRHLGNMSGKRSLSYALAALTLPLLLCLPYTLVAAFSIYDYIPSNLGSSDGRSTLVRRADVPELGYYNPLDYGGYMMTVSFLFPQGRIAGYVVYVGLSLCFPCWSVY